MLAAFRAAHADPTIGTRLELAPAAGRARRRRRLRHPGLLAAPEDPRGPALFAAVMRSLAPKIRAAGIATEAELDLPTLQMRIAEAHARGRTPSSCCRPSSARSAAAQRRSGPARPGRLPADAARGHRPPVPPAHLVRARARVGRAASTTRASCRTSRRTTSRRSRRTARRTRTGCRSSSCRASWPLGRRAPRRRCSPAAHAAPPASLDLAHLARLLHLSRRRRARGRAQRRPALPLPRGGLGGRAVPVRALRRGARRRRARRTACTGSTRCTTRWCRSGRRRTARRRRWSSPASRGAPAGATPSAASATSTGTPARCWRTPRAGEDAGLAPRLRTVFPDAAVTRLVGADGVHEFPLAIAQLGDGEPAIGPAGPAARRGRPARAARVPLVTEAQHAGDGERLGAPGPPGRR